MRAISIFRPKTLPVRVALAVTLAVGVLMTLFIGLALLKTKSTLEKQVTDEALNNAKRFASFTLGYFYYQDNFIHLTTQQKALSASPNVLYSYIVSSKGEIIVGTDGIDSSDIGLKKQIWEPDTTLDALQSEIQFAATSTMPEKFKLRTGQAGLIRLASLPLNCEEQIDNCAHLRIALFPDSHKPFLVSLTLFLIAISSGIVVLSGLVTYSVARKILIPISVISRQLELSATGGKIDLDMAQKSDLGTAVEIVALRNSLDNFVKVLETSSRDAAVASTTQAMAHDVRKPFTMIQMIMDALETVEDPIKAKHLLKDALPEVQQAIASVNGMIADVLEMGAVGAPQFEPTNPETLIEFAVNQIFRIYPDSNVNIQYQFHHVHKVMADTSKISRVFSNLVGNAIQAMMQKGDMWFKTEEINVDSKKFIKFCIGNSGSFIPKAIIEKLFEAFFTFGKKGGTGLGLAIAQKIVSSHGGKIWCQSHETKGTEFFLTLPCSTQTSDPLPNPLPASGSEILARVERLRKTHQPESATYIQYDLESKIEKQILQALSKNDSPLKILIVDDEGVYRNSLASILSKPEKLRSAIKLEFAQNGNQALSLLAQYPDTKLVILDVDLGMNTLNGYDVLIKMRKANFHGVVCIHSNRSLSTDYRIAMDAGADAVLPKPMGRAHLLKLILQALHSTSEV